MWFGRYDTASNLGVCEGRPGNRTINADGDTVSYSYQGDNGGTVVTQYEGGGHIRLSPYRKEALLEIDHENTANLTGLPQTGLQTYFEYASELTIDSTHGAEIYLYYIFDDTSLHEERMSMRFSSISGI
jgi:hypothetical protein